MDIGKAFSFVFEDEKWLTKVLIGGLLSLVPIVNFAVVGYALKVAENVARGVERPLPEWSDFGDLFMRGLYNVVIGVVYAIPAIIIACVGGGILGAIAGAASGDLDSGSGTGSAALGLGVIFFYFVSLVLILASTLVALPATARYVATGQLSEAFKFGEVFGLFRRSLGTWILLLLVSILASIVGSLGAIACGIGALFTLVYGQMMYGHVLGQVVRSQGLGSPAAVENPSPFIPPATYQ